MFKNTLIKAQNLIMLSLLPFICGCLSGGGAGEGGDSFVGALGSGGVGTGGGAGGGGGEAVRCLGDSCLEVVTNPEPATMLLLGSGLVAMRYLKTKNKWQ